MGLAMAVMAGLIGMWKRYLPSNHLQDEDDEEEDEDERTLEQSSSVGEVRNNILGRKKVKACVPLELYLVVDPL